MTFTADQAWIIPLIPLSAFVVIALFHNILPGKGDWIGILAILGAWALSVLVLVDGARHWDSVHQDAFGRVLGEHTFNWIQAGNFNIELGFLVDPITVVMLIVVTTVAAMVNIYATGYMHGEQRYGWFYAVLALFAFTMLILVLADNLLLVFAGWELVGLCSYFLIGFYWERRSAAEAAKKAFITNRIGDVGLLIGIILLWRATGTFNIREILEAAETGEIGHTYLMVSSLFLLLGPIAKSAQLPLHVWLPDAMEGPTPVSALIHAATMVVAGVYLVARMLPLFEAADLLPVILTIGMITAIFAAIVALTQTDLKKVIAYSTLSNLGIMFVALGTGSVTAAMFHLMTHAFFKACLFLGAGSVIHSVHTQEMPEMGGLRKKMPVTFWTFFLAALANAGVIPLAGFWSKDEILASLTRNENVVWYLLTIFWVLLSGMYTARMLYYTWFGQPRDRDKYDHAHESPFNMTLPLYILGALAVVAGFVVIPGVARAIGLPDGFGALVYNAAEGPEEFHFDKVLAIAGTGSVIVGMLFSAWLVSRSSRVQRFTAAIPGPYNLARNKFYFDEMYQWLIDRVVLVLAYGVAWFDRNIVNDTGVDGTSSLTSYIGYRLKFAQTGKIPNYAFAIVVGILTLAIVAFSTRT